MPPRLYYTDAYLSAFDAAVVACDVCADRHAVRLDRTAFYPTSGGQPFDVGRLNDIEIVDVVEDDDGEVVHVASAPIAAGTRVRGAIDWARRFDHMQQHTGQHVLSAAFDRDPGVRTVSFHLGADVSTIDLERDLTANEIARAEEQANRVVWEDRPVTVRFVSSEEAKALPLRKAPAREGELRLVDVQDFDLSACGGTHVRTTGGIGLIAVTGTERFKGGVRVSFACGGRALASHRRLRDGVAGASRLLSASGTDLVAHIERLIEEGKEGARVAADLQLQLARYRAREWRDEAETIGGARVVLRTEPGVDAGVLKAVAQAIVVEPGLIVVLVGGGRPAPIVAARSADVGFDAGAFVRAATTALGGRGGGRPELAQAGLAADADRIVAFVRQHLSA